MEIRKLETEAERLEATNVLAASFMHIMEAEKDGEYWAAFEHGAMNAALWAGRTRRNLDGHSVSCAEMYMLGSLPEARERGAASEILKKALRVARERGDLFCTLIPFSFAISSASALGSLPRVNTTARMSSMSQVRMTWGLTRPVKSTMCSLGKASTSLIMSLEQAHCTSNSSSN